MVLELIAFQWPVRAGPSNQERGEIEAPHRRGRLDRLAEFAKSKALAGVEARHRESLVRAINGALWYRLFLDEPLDAGFVKRMTALAGERS